MDALTVSELSVRAGVPVSTIHHYRQRGLLPPPLPAGRNRFRYGDEHVRALRLIRRLRERRGLSLEQIAEILPQLLAGEQEAFRPAMWDRLLDAQASADPTTSFRTCSLRCFRCSSSSPPGGPGAGSRSSPRRATSSAASSPSSKGS